MDKQLHASALINAVCGWPCSTVVLLGITVSGSFNYIPSALNLGYIDEPLYNVARYK